MLADVSPDARGIESIGSYVMQQGLSCLNVLEGPALRFSRVSWARTDLVAGSGSGTCVFRALREELAERS